MCIYAVILILRIKRAEHGKKGGSMEARFHEFRQGNTVWHHYKVNVSCKGIAILL